MSARITIVKTGEPVPFVQETRGQFADLIREAIGPVWPGAYEVFDARTDDYPHPKGSSAFIITGSAANVPNREAWMLRAEAWLRDVASAGTPTFGICFGHQILAQALGGEVIKNPSGREIGTTTIEVTEDDPIFAALPASFSANVTHIDTVGKLPPGARSLARSSRDENQAIRFTETCWGVQFHPEIDAGVMRHYVEARREILTTEGFLVDAVLAEIGAGEQGREALRSFVKHAVLPHEG